ncbi:MAG: universal stress protein [Thermoleophilia bacterium]
MAAPYAHIACCWDGSPASEAAVAEARRLLEGGGRLSVVHVHSDPPIYGGMYEPDLGALRETARRWFAEQAAAWPGAEAVFLEGAATVEIDAWLEQARPDLVVAGVHHGAARRAVLGSVTNHLAQHAPCPVLIVRAEDDAS